ncbi:hypothetical protein MASR1M90_16790 [Desulfovibrionales bacterium]
MKPTAEVVIFESGEARVEVRLQQRDCLAAPGADGRVVWARAFGHHQASAQCICRG